jgi:hypothetical protein
LLQQLYGFTKTLITHKAVYSLSQLALWHAIGLVVMIQKSHDSTAVLTGAVFLWLEATIVKIVAVFGSRT